MSQNTRNVKRAYVEPPRQQATTDLKCQEVQGEFSLVINMVIKSIEKVVTNLQRGCAAMRCLLPDRILCTCTHPTTERVGSFWYHLSCGLLRSNYFFAATARGFCSVIEDHTSTTEGYGEPPEKDALALNSVRQERCRWRSRAVQGSK